MSFDEIAGHWLRRSESVLYLKISGEGRVRSWNPAVPARTGYGEDELRGSDLRVLLAEGEAARILQAASEADPEAPRLVNFVDAEQTPLTFSCRLYPDGTDVHIVGADLVDEWKRLEEKRVSMTREMAVLAREKARQARQLASTKERLEKTLAELRNSYWHLKKIQEVIPLCMFCGRIHSTGSSWDDVAEYLRKNSILVSHGLCPECRDREYGKPPGEDSAGSPVEGSDGSAGPGG